MLLHRSIISPLGTKLAYFRPKWADCQTIKQQYFELRKNCWFLSLDDKISFFDIYLNNLNPEGQVSTSKTSRVMGHNKSKLQWAWRAVFFEARSWNFVEIYIFCLSTNDIIMILVHLLWVKSLEKPLRVSIPDLSIPCISTMNETFDMR